MLLKIVFEHGFIVTQKYQSIEQFKDSLGPNIRPFAYVKDDSFDYIVYMPEQDFWIGDAGYCDPQVDFSEDVEDMEEQEDPELVEPEIETISPEELERMGFISYSPSYIASKIGEKNVYSFFKENILEYYDDDRWSKYKKKFDKEFSGKDPFEAMQAGLI